MKNQKDQHLPDDVVRDMLNHIPIESLVYKQWVGIGMGLKNDHYPFEIWDEWSAKDTREGQYQGTEKTRKKWDSFDKEGYTLRTVKDLARKNGWTYPKNNSGYMDWEDEIYSDWEPDQATDRTTTINPEDTIEFLRQNYHPEEFVKIITQCKPANNKGKFSPIQSGKLFYKVGKLVEDLKNGKTLESIIGPYNHQAGVWIGVNPVDGKGCSRGNVTECRSLLIESDLMPIDVQLKWLEESKLPITTITYSGGRSLHAILRVDAEDPTEYGYYWKRLEEEIKKLNEKEGSIKFELDEANKDIGRLTRLPGCVRGNNVQKLYKLKRKMITSKISNVHDWLQIIRKPPFFEIDYRGRKKFMHAWMGSWILRTETIKKLNGILHIYDRKTGLYIPLDEKWDYITRNLLKEISTHQQNEVKKYLKDTCSQYDEEELDESRFIGFSNGFYNLETGHLEKKSKNRKMVSKIPYQYKKVEKKTNEKCVQYLMEWANYDEDVAILLTEIIGSCLLSAIIDPPTMFFLFGQKATGKSVFLNLLENILGENNFVAKAPQEFTESFGKEQLLNKKANIRSDIGAIPIKDTSLLKQIVSGDTINANRKYKDHIKFKPFATHVYACNNLPEMKDDQGSIARRLVIVPFVHQFTPGKVNMNEIISDQDIIEGFINWGIKGLMKIRKDKDFIHPEICEEFKKDYLQENNSVKAWIEANGWDTVEKFLKAVNYPRQSTSWKSVHAQYESFCIEEGLDPITKNQLKNEVINYYGVNIETKPVAVPGSRDRIRQMTIKQSVTKKNRK